MTRGMRIFMEVFPLSDCLFCKIAAGEIPSNKVYEDEYVYAFRDINPQAPVHILVIPKAHVASVPECAALPEGMCDRLMKVCGDIARAERLDKTGFRIVSNCGDDACQSVHHWHIHILGGRKMADKMA